MFKHNTPAKAKLTFNQKLKMYQLLVSFSHSEDFTKRNADHVSGDFPLNAENLIKQIEFASQVLRTSNITLIQQ